MLIKVLYNIGRIQSTKRPLFIDLIEFSQRPLKEDNKGDLPKILVGMIEINNENGIVGHPKIILEDYNPDKKYDYLFGRTSGSKTNYSLSVTVNYEPSKKERLKITWKKITDIGKKINDKKFNGALKKKLNWYLSIVKYISEHQNELNDSILKSLETNFGDRKYSTILTFKIKKGDNQKYLYQGEIEECKSLYEELFFMDKRKVNTGSCIFCKRTKDLIKGFEIGGLFTIDQHSFRMSFFEGNKELTNQYLMCRECYIIALKGFNIAETKLKFNAFRRRLGSKTKQIYHYILPLSDDERTIEEHLKLIGRLTAKIKEHTENAAREITELRNRLRILDNKTRKNTNNDDENPSEKEDLRRKLQIKERELERLENKYKNRIIEILDFINECGGVGNISILDIYFQIGEEQHYPPTRSLVTEIFLSGKRIEVLNNIIKKAKIRLKEILNPYKPINTDTISRNLYKLYHITNKEEFLGWSEYISCYSRLFNLEKMDRAKFFRRISNKLKVYMAASLREINSERADKDNRFRNAITAVETFDILMELAGLWR